MKFSNNILLYTLIPLTILSLGASYLRFMVNHDYYVAYEGECDPYLSVCFIGCEDDECSEEYFYSEIHKYAADLYKQCDNDIIDCEAANSCLPEDSDRCSIIFCDPATDSDSCEEISLEQTDSLNQHLSPEEVNNDII